MCYFCMVLDMLKRDQTIYTEKCIIKLTINRSRSFSAGMLMNRGGDRNPARQF